MENFKKIMSIILVPMVFAITVILVVTAIVVNVPTVDKTANDFMAKYTRGQYGDAYLMVAHNVAYNLNFVKDTESYATNLAEDNNIDYEGYKFKLKSSKALSDKEMDELWGEDNSMYGTNLYVRKDQAEDVVVRIYELSKKNKDTKKTVIYMGKIDGEWKVLKAIFQNNTGSEVVFN